MAEDLSIKLKVEPDGGDVQGKLDKIAKDKKFNVQIGDKNLKTQLKSISKTISGTLEKAMANTMKAIDDYAKSAQQAASVIEQAQKREQAALISNVNLLAKNAQERKEITNAIQGQVAAQNKLRNETALTAAQENELRKMSNRDLTIRQLRAEQQEWEQLDTPCHFRKMMKCSTQRARCFRILRHFLADVLPRKSSSVILRLVHQMTSNVQLRQPEAW